MAWFDSFNAMVTADLDSSFIGGTEWADTVVYHPQDASPAEKINCQVSRGVEKITDESNHVLTLSVINVLCRRLVAVGIAEPKIGDWIEWDGEEWDYLLTKGADLGAACLVFQKSTVEQFGRTRGQM